MQDRFKRPRKPLVNMFLVYTAIARNWSIDISTCILHDVITSSPDMKKRSRQRMSPILHPTKFGLASNYLWLVVVPQFGWMYWRRPNAPGITEIHRMVALSVVRQLGWIIGIKILRQLTAGWRNAARWLVDLLSVNQTWRHHNKFVAWQVESLMKNEQQSQNLLLKVDPGSTLSNNFLQPATNAFVARQVDRARWKTRNIDQKLKTKQCCATSLGFLYPVFRRLKSKQWWNFVFSSFLRTWPAILWFKALERQWTAETSTLEEA